MKTFRSIAASLFFAAALFTVSAFAQTTPTQPAAGVGRIVTINTAAFEDTKAGITRYVNAMTALDNEFKPAYTELQTMGTRLQTLQKQYNDLYAEAQKPNSPIKPEALQAKLDEIQGIQVEFKRKQEDAKLKFERRQAVVMGPVMQDIMKAISDFTKQKGYGLVLDAAKLDNAGIILGWDEAKIDVTKEFIVFYNARPATTAVTTPTK
ncbi:MAG TPA: OmpH family outer membrane protein [Pyrinomonadaceae bacterium]|nr:OmpH family outer membrane protein [Pyrinomonadaceae bacterium]